MRIRGFGRFQHYGNSYAGRIYKDYTDVPIAVSSANVTVKRTPSQVWALVTDMQTAAPLPGVPVTVYNAGEAIASGHTDENGVFNTNIDLFDDIESSPQGDTAIIVVAQKEETFGIWYSWQETTGPTQASYIYTDRPIYRPGETIHFKGFLLDRWDMDFSAPSDEQTARVYANYVVDHVGQEPIFDEQLSLSEFGSFSGAIEIPENIPLGQLRIFYEVGRDYEEFYHNYSANGLITVEIVDFRVNNHEVNASVDKDEIIQGDPIEINVDSHFYSGEGVSNAGVVLNILGGLKLFKYAGDGQYQFYDENWRIPNRYPYYGEHYDRYGNCQQYYDGIRQRNGDRAEYRNGLTTDSGGILQFETDQTYFHNHRPSDMLVEATVHSGGQYVSAQDFVMAHPAEVYVGIQANPRRVVSKGDQVTYEIITVDLDSNSVPNRPVQLILEEIIWEPFRDYTAFGWYDRWREKALLIDESFTISNEEGLVHYTYVPDRPGTYRLRAIALDENGRSISATYRVYVTGHEFRGWYPSENHQLEIVTGSDDFQIGDRLDIFTALPEEAKWTIWLSIERTEVIYQDVFYVDGSSFEHQLDVLKEFASHADISIVAVRGPTADDPHPEYYLASKPITVATDFRQLDISIVLSTQEAQPGDNVSFEIRVADYEGNPVRAELSIKLTDAAILDLLPPNSTTLDSAFYGRYWHSVDTGISLRDLLDRYIVPLPNPFSGGGNGGGGCCPGPKVPRVKFEQTPLWEPHVVTDENGKAVVSVQMPYNLTRWELEVKAFTTDGLIGETTTDVTTNLPLTVRPITPRFFVVGDHLQIGAIVANNSDTDQQVTSSVYADGVALEEEVNQQVTIDAHTQKDIYWWVTVEDTDFVDLTFAVEDEQGNQDATKPMLTTGDNHTIPVYRYVAPDIVATVGVLTDAGRSIEGIAIPHRLLDADSGELMLNIDSSLADTTLAGLDYLRQYPYQCIEQTVSRFLPNIATYQALKTFNLHDWSLKINLLIAFQKAHDTLQASQHSFGGWGWFPGVEQPDVQVTAYAVLGLLEAQKAGLTVDQDMLDKALSYLDYPARSPEELRQLENSRDLNLQAFLYYVLANNRTDLLPQLDALYDQREKLSLQSRAFLLMSYDKVRPDSIAVPVLVDELRNAAIYTSTGVHWSDNASGYNWTTSTRTTALVLKALLVHDPENDLLPQVVRWLITQREHKHWSSTQETTWAILALTDWMVYTKELRSDYSYDVRLNDGSVDNGEVSPDTPLEDRALVITVEEYLTDETNYLSVSRSDGDGSLYYSAYLHLNFKASDVEAVGRGITIDRQYILDEDEGSSITEAQQGDLITVRLSFTLTEDVHYFVLEDPIPAGVEMVDTQLLTTTRQADGEQFQRGNYWGWGWWWIDRTELQDHQARLYADFLPAGSYVYSYQVRATHQGEFQVIPTQAMAFYTPEIFARSNGMELTITD